MKTIQSIQLWNAGQQSIATILDAYVINDNLSTTANFYFALFDQNMNTIQTGNLTMLGSDYISYETNQDAFSWVAKKLNIIITGDYTPDKFNL